MVIERIFGFSIPVNVHFEVGGAGKIAKILDSLQAKNALLVTDKGIAGSGSLSSITGSLEKAGLSYLIFDEVEPNPSMETAERASSIINENNCDVVVGVGGGSSIDAAKAAAVLTSNPGPLTQYEGPDKIPNPVLPIIAVPTTAGTGSEINGSTVITDKVRKYKMSIRSQFLVPKMALLDPSLMRSLPQNVIASTGMDALVHAVESYISLGATPMTEALALRSIELISENIRAFYANPDNLEAAGNMLIASSMASMSFSNARLGVIHAIAHALGGYYNIPHGLACAVLLPPAMEFSLIAVPEKLAKIATIMGGCAEYSSPLAAAEKSIGLIRELMRQLDLPENLEQFGVNEAEIPAIAKNAVATGIHLSTPRRVDLECIERIMKAAFTS